jgi:hypothetical protein
MTTSTKGKPFTYTGGLDGIEVHLPNHTYHFVSGETVEVCGHCAPALAQHADFTSGTKKAPADSTPKEV